jgi:hypothetical protein
MGRLGSQTSFERHAMFATKIGVKAGIAANYFFIFTY